MIAKSCFLAYVQVASEAIASGFAVYCRSIGCLEVGAASVAATGLRWVYQCLLRFEFARSHRCRRALPGLYVLVLLLAVPSLRSKRWALSWWCGFARHTIPHPCLACSTLHVGLRTSMRGSPRSPPSDCVRGGLPSESCHMYWDGWAQNIRWSKQFQISMGNPCTFMASNKVVYSIR